MNNTTIWQHGFHGAIAVFSFTVASSFVAVSAQSMDVQTPEKIAKIFLLGEIRDSSMVTNAD
jgi:hypothetical protein